MLVLSPQPATTFDMSTVEALRFHDSVFETPSPIHPDFGLLFDSRMSDRHLSTTSMLSVPSTVTTMDSGVDPRMLSNPGQSQGESQQPKKSLKRKASSDVEDESVERPSKRVSYPGYTAPDYRNTAVMPISASSAPRQSVSQSSYFRPDSSSYSSERFSTSNSESDFLTPAYTSPLQMGTDNRAWTLSPGLLASPAPSYTAAPVSASYQAHASSSYSQPPERPRQANSSSYTFPPIFSTPSSNTPNLPSLSSAAGGEKVIPVKPPSVKPRCWDHGCNGRTFSTFSNLLRHQRERSGVAQKTFCPRCGAEFTRSTARNMHLQNAKCKARRHSSYQ